MNDVGWFEDMRKLGLVTRLPESLADGIVEKITIFNNDNGVLGEVREVSILRLTVGSAIKKHKHIIDSETYSFFNCDIVLKCNVNEEHELKNFLKGDLFILAVKRFAWI